MGRRRPWMVVAAVVVAVVAVAVVWMLWFPGVPFDKAAWRDTADLSQGPRAGMADRLVARRTLLGMTRTEVVDMLGQPPESYVGGPSDLVYKLGAERSFISLDSEWLVVRFGPDGRVTECKIGTD